MVTVMRTICPQSCPRSWALELWLTLQSLQGKVLKWLNQLEILQMSYAETPNLPQNLGRLWHSTKFGFKYRFKQMSLKKDSRNCNFLLIRRVQLSKSLLFSSDSTGRAVINYWQTEPIFIKRFMVAIWILHATNCEPKIQMALWLYSSVILLLNLALIASHSSI